MRTNIFIVSILFTFAAQSVESAFIRLNFESKICTCNHGSKKESHTSNSEDSIFKNRLKPDKSEAISPSASAKLPDCHSVKDTQAVHACACKKHNEAGNAKELSAFSFQFLEPTTAVILSPFKIQLDSFIEFKTVLALGHFDSLIKPPRI
ncbi:hypothetical protein CH373_17525 [Leptospira perolatii]|uniref:Uncharacterized protein n=1 Tax=Leptospira perolatii TaxID=2023191 RepID=A0A2M9ZI90_9LEPT|nr:hypothetical protein [Leptospira perolatii]PJZ69076.1 hypothetical protein CH360_12370 [Leptospira perolatii]PJZ71785.1 hypothetical protein CH373_17525 [Leptospira perolatii]